MLCRTAGLIDPSGQGLPMLLHMEIALLKGQFGGLQARLFQVGHKPLVKHPSRPQWKFKQVREPG